MSGVNHYEHYVFDVVAALQLLGDVPGYDNC